MGITSGMKKIVKPYVDVSSWFSADYLAGQTRGLTSMFKSLFVRQEAEHSETLDEAVSRLGLSQAEILTRKHGYYRTAIIIFILGLGMFGYSLYLLINLYFNGFFVAISMTSVAMAVAFRYHFWYFQLKKRKLGCTFDEWLKEGLLGYK